MYDYEIKKDESTLSIPDTNEEDAVYDGTKIFEFFFEGTSYKKYKDYNGPPEFQGLNPSNFGHWIYVFDRCVADLTERSQGRPCIERWWDAIKKVI
jgi:hypothetical protein